MEENINRSYKDIATGECLRTIGAEIKEFAVPSLATPLCMILEVIMEMMIPLLMARIIDFGVEAGSMEVILGTGGLMLLLAFIGLMAGIGGGVFGARASAGLAMNLRAKMYRSIQGYSFSNIDRF